MSIHAVGEQIYKVRWREGGRNRSLTVHGPLVLAQKIERKKMSLRDENRHLDVKQETNFRMVDLIAKYEAEYSQKKKNPQREKTILRHAREFFGRYFVREVDAAVAKRWYMDICDKVQTNTALRHYNTMHHMFKKAATLWSAETGIVRNPFDSVEVVRPDDRRERFLSIEEMGRLKRYLDEHLYIKGTKLPNRTMQRLRMLVLLSLTTGMRITEVFRLSWGDVRWDEGLIAVGARLKRGGFRYVPLTREMATELRQYPRLGERVFPSDSATPSVASSWRTLRREIKLTDFRFHDLRHTFASWYMMNGGELYTLAKILGHSNIKMTERYAKLAKAHIATSGGVAGEIWEMMR